ncbi:MAG: sigma-70 family RNA polymerase sigma factor [Polyangiaceae bacterium]
MSERTPEAVVEAEQRISAAFKAGELRLAATSALEAYADEIASFLGARLRSPSDAAEVFSMFVEDLWAGLPNFAWRCSMRTWAYALARNASARYLTSPQRRPNRALPLSELPEISALIDRVRSTTHAFQRTDTKDRFRALREQLDSEDQMLLVLRVDRELSWRDLALAMTGDTELDEAALVREAARLRKAFERVKIELRRLAEREGLLKSKG